MRGYRPLLWTLAWLWCLVPAVVAAELPRLQVFASDHYHIHTDLTRTQTVPFGRHMDAVFDEYVRRFAAFEQRDSGPMPLYLFSRSEDYHAFLKSLGIEARHSGGMFFVTHDARGLATYIDNERIDETYAVLQHEGFHQFAWTRLGPDLPTWVNEGLAQYFEDAPLVNGRLVVGATDRTRLKRVRQALQGRQTLPLGTLFGLSERQWGDALHTDADHSGLIYAQAWSVVYFLIHGEDGKYRDAFNRYLQAVSTGREEGVAFAEAFGGSNPSSMQRRWAAYVQGMEAPAMSAATEGLEFLATAVRYYDQQGWPVPDRLDDLETQLQAIKFAVRRVEQGHESTLSSADPGVFEFGIPGGATRRFELLEPSRNDLPPRIAAPGLSPEPRVEWTRLGDGSLRHTLVYR